MADRKNRKLFFIQPSESSDLANLRMYNAKRTEYHLSDNSGKDEWVIDWPKEIPSRGEKKTRVSEEVNAPKVRTEKIRDEEEKIAVQI